MEHSLSREAGIARPAGTVGRLRHGVRSVCGQRGGAGDPAAVRRHFAGVGLIVAGYELAFGVLLIAGGRTGIASGAGVCSASACWDLR